MGRAWFRELSTCQGSKSGKDHEQNVPGATGRSAGGGAMVPLGSLSPMCPLANQGKAQSPQDRGTGPDEILEAKAQCTPCSCGAMLGGTLAWSTFHQGLGYSHSARQCPASQHRLAGPPTDGLGCSLAKLSSLAPGLPTIPLVKGPAPSEGSTKKAHHPLQCLPCGLWLSIVGDTCLPLGRDDGPGPECTVGVPGQGPPLS